MAYIYPLGTPAIDTFTSQGNGQYTEAGYSLGAGFDASSGTWAAGDVNGDGKTDLTYIYEPGAAIDNFTPQGNGQYTEASYSLGAGFDAGSGTWTITGYAPAVPGSPSSASAVPGNGSAIVTWHAPPAPVAPVVAYNITPYANGVAQPTQTFTSPATTETITGLANGKSYTFAVAAINNGGVGPATITTVVTLAAPSAPTSVKAKAGHKQATVSWKAPAANGKPAVTGYVVTPYIKGAAQPARTFSSRVTTEVVKRLTSGKKCSFSVRAVNSIGTGHASAKSNAVKVK